MYPGEQLAASAPTAPERSTVVASSGDNGSAFARDSYASPGGPERFAFVKHVRVCCPAPQLCQRLDSVAPETHCAPMLVSRGR
jgi:hypothetical protein